MGHQTFREDRGGETEFVAIFYWRDLGSMAASAGDDPTAIRHLDRGPEFLIELPQCVQILQIRRSHGRTDDGSR